MVEALYTMNKVLMVFHLNVPSNSSWFLYFSLLLVYNNWPNISFTLGGLLLLIYVYLLIEIFVVSKWSTPNLILLGHQILIFCTLCDMRRRILIVLVFVCETWWFWFMLCFQAYLSLPEGTASVVGLIAMMTDHYSVLVRLDFNFNTQL
jgi:hypothetical protein